MRPGSPTSARNAGDFVPTGTDVDGRSSRVWQPQPPCRSLPRSGKRRPLRASYCRIFHHGSSGRGSQRTAECPKPSLPSTPDNAGVHVVGNGAMGMTTLSMRQPKSTFFCARLSTPLSQIVGNCCSRSSGAARRVGSSGTGSCSRWTWCQMWKSSESFTANGQKFRVVVMRCLLPVPACRDLFLGAPCFAPKQSSW